MGFCKDCKKTAFKLIWITKYPLYICSDSTGVTQKTTGIFSGLQKIQEKRRGDSIGFPKKHEELFEEFHNIFCMGFYGILFFL